MAVYGPWPTPPGRPGAGPVTEVHRPRGRQAVDVVGAPAYDPKATDVGDPGVAHCLRANSIDSGSCR